MDNINPTYIENKLNGLVKTYFEEDITMQKGDSIILNLIESTINNQKSSYTDNFLSTSSHSEGNYYSYQLTFYPITKGSFCFIVLSLISFKDSESVFGIPTKFRTGISYNIQVFEVWKTYNVFRVDAR